MRLIERSVVVCVRRSMCVSVCLFVYTNTQPAGTVAPSCENFYIGGDMHSHERLLVKGAYRAS